MATAVCSGTLTGEKSMGTSCLRRGVVLAAFAAACLVSACGGSGGVGPSEAVPPGTLTALVVEGAATPAGGAFGPLGPATLLSAADGRWTAFVADVVGGTIPRGLFVALPAGGIVLVYAKGEVVPASNGATGTIDDFDRIWMRPNGVVATLVEIAGGSGEGVLTAVVSGAGAVGSKATAVHQGRSLPQGNSPSDPGILTAIDDDHVEVSDAGHVCFMGTGSAVPAIRGVWTVSRDGSQSTALAVTDEPVNDPASGTLGTLGTGFSGLGIDADGEFVSFACDVVGMLAEALFLTRGTGLAVLARDGNAPPSALGRIFDDVYDGGPIAVRVDGTGAGDVTWHGSLTGLPPDGGIFTRGFTLPVMGTLLLGALNDVILPSEVIPGTNGGIAADCRILPGQDDPSRWPIEVLVDFGNTDRVFLSAADKDTLEEVFRQGSPAPGTLNTFSNTYPSLTLARNDAASRDGSFAFTAVLVDASTGLWWPVFGSSLFLVAEETATAPGTGGGHFGSFSTPSAVSVALGFVAFRAAVVGGTTASAIFRQG